MNTAPYTDEEVKVYLEREKRFTLRPNSMDALLDAEVWANILHNRDRDMDDRISCGECKQGKSGVCSDVVPKPWDVLHRCDHFAAGPFDADLDLPVVRNGWKKPVAAKPESTIPHARDF